VGAIQLGAREKDYKRAFILPIWENRMRGRSLFVLAVGLLVVPTVFSAHAPSPETHYFSRINAHHDNPTNMSVVVVPSGYLSSTAHLGNLGWIGPDALRDAPGTQAVLEAIDYWAWMIDEFEDVHPQLAHVSYHVKILGVDADASSLATAKIVVTTAMAQDPFPFVFHLGIGLPTLPPTALTNPGNTPMRLCTTWNTGLGAWNNTADQALFGDGPTDVDPLRLRNLAIHEFGHCLATGHTGGETRGGHPDSRVCNSHNTCYLAPNAGTHDEDVMSYVHGFFRQCLSNLNLQSLAQAYAFLPGAWQPHPRETYMVKGDYAQTCMPQSLGRF